MVLTIIAQLVVSVFVWWMYYVLTGMVPCATDRCDGAAFRGFVWGWAIGAPIWVIASITVFVMSARRSRAAYAVPLMATMLLFLGGQLVYMLLSSVDDYSGG